MTEPQQRVLWFLIAAVAIIQVARADPPTEEIADSYSEARIAALNQVVATYTGSSLSATTEVVLANGERATVSRTKEELARRGVSVKLLDGRYVNVTKQVERGHFLPARDRTALATLNNLQQTYCVNLAATQKVPGEVRASMDVIKGRLEQRGIFLEMDGDLFVVRAVRGDAESGIHPVGDHDVPRANQDAH